MAESAITSSFFRLSNARKTLDIGIKSWFIVAFTGQCAFAIYILSVYALSVMAGIDIKEVSPTQAVRHADGMNTLVLLAHVLPAAYLSFFGLLQFIPKLRSRYPKFHRINGRIFLLLGFFGALSGLYLQWGAGFRLSDIGSIGITLNGFLIPVAVIFAWRHAVNKKFDHHMRWAMHSFFLVNGVWTFRLYLMGWYLVNQGPNGNSRTLDGPMDIFLSFACYLLPMIIGEIVLWSKKQRNETKVWGSAIVMSLGAIITLIGVIAALLMMWSPRIITVFTLI